MVDVGGTPVVATGGYGDCFGGGGLVSILLIFALLGGIGHHGEHGGIGELNGRFNAIEDKIDNANNLAETRLNLKETCDTHMDVLNKAGELGKEVMENRFTTSAGFYDTRAAIDKASFDNAMIAKNAEIQSLKCCCETQQHMDSVERNILSRIDANEIQNLRDKVSELQVGLSQSRQNEYLIGALRPAPVPAYVTYNPAQQVFPPSPSVPAQGVYGSFGGYAV